MNPPAPTPLPEARRTYVWPWFLLAAVVLGIVLAVIWVAREAQRTQRLRQWNSPPASTATNSASSQAR